MEEAVRSQIEGRAPELAELLRGRGVNLAHIKTSIADGEAGGGGSDDGRRGNSDERSEAVAAQSVAMADAPPVVAGETNISNEDTDALAATRDRERATRYRA